MELAFISSYDELLSWSAVKLMLWYTDTFFFFPAGPAFSQCLLGSIGFSRGSGAQASLRHLEHGWFSTLVGCSACVFQLVLSILECLQHQPHPPRSTWKQSILGRIYVSNYLSNISLLSLNQF